MQAVYAPWLQRQRALRCCVCLVLGRYYNMLKLAPHRPSAEKGEKLSPFSGHHATSRYVASLHGVNEKTVRNTAEVAEVVIPSVPTTPTTRAPHGAACSSNASRERESIVSVWWGSGSFAHIVYTDFTAGTKARPRFVLCPEKGDKLSTFTAGTEARPTGVKLTPVRPHSRFALCPDNGVNLTPLSAGTEVRSTHCISCAMIADRKRGQFDLLFGAPCDRAAAERYNGSVCCAAAYALSCPLRSLRFCCSRVLTPRSQSSITDVSA